MSSPGVLPADDARAATANTSMVLLPWPARRETRVVDLIGAAAAAAGLVVLAAVASPPSGAETALFRFLDAAPDLTHDVWQLVTCLPLAFASVLVAVAVRRGHRGALSAMGAAALASLAVTFLATRLGPDQTRAWWGSLDPAGAERWFPSGSLVGPTAMVLVAGAYLTAPMRRLVTLVVGASTASVALLAVAPPSGAIAGLLAALLGARVAQSALGTPSGEPDTTRVIADLADVGIRATHLEQSGVPRTGVRSFAGTDHLDRSIFVQVSSSDARDARLATVVLRRAWYRHVGEPLLLGRLRSAQHVALQTLLAHEAGIRTDQVQRVGRAANGDALLVTRPAAGTPLHQRTGPDGAPVGPRLWPLVSRLHEAGLSHGQVDLEHLVDDGADLALVGYERSTSAPSPAQRRIDEAQSLVTSVLADGADDAIAAAREALGNDGLIGVISFIQPAVLTRSQNKALGAGGLDLATLRAEAAAATGTPDPPITPVRRVKILAAAQAVLLPVAVMGLWAIARELDLDRLGEQISDASWALLAVGLVVAQLPRVAQVFSSLGVAPVPLPLMPLYALQLSVSYVNLVIPGGAARVAITVRFYQRHGLPSGSALAVGAIDGLSGLVTQIVLVAAILLAGATTLDLDLAGAIDLTRYVGRALGLVLVVTALLVLAPRLRRVAFGWVGTATGDAAAVIRGLRSPRRWGLIGGGNLVAELCTALALATFLRAFGYSVGFGELLLITMTVSVLAWVIPVPGGIGVSETGLVIGLIGAGLPEEGAFAAMVVHRLATFYLPPIWGFFALRWLERNQYV